MIQEELARIAGQERDKGSRPEYIRNLLKEYLQVYVLFFVYTSPDYNKRLIFTGGTCLKHFYELDRLSEDIDFDHIGELDASELSANLGDFFSKRYRYPDARISLKQQEAQVLVKFPVLRAMGLEYPGGSDLLHVKMDLSPVPSSNYSAVVSSQSRYGFNYAARHYDLPDLMAGKLHAVLRRQVLKGREDRRSVKGRDYFDLLWFIKRRVAPNMLRLSDMLGEELSPAEVVARLRQKVDELGKMASDFRADILPLVRNKEAVELYVDNYREEFLRAVKEVEWTGVRR